MKRVVALPDSASNLNGQIKSQTSSEEGQANDVEILVDEATLPYQGYVVEKREITVAIGAMCAASWRWSNKSMRLFVSHRAARAALTDDRAGRAKCTSAVNTYLPG